MYTEDSFFTLGTGGQIGLALLSVCLFALCLALVFYLGRSWRRLPRIGLAIALFWAFEWLSPQIYYQYYILVFDGLPWQIVIKSPPSPERIAKLLLFSHDPSLSAHGRGLLAWAMIAIALLKLPQRSELTASHNSE
ncbi:MAG: hypothetical protein AAFN80_05170 [Pseudomonadota bacterium]